MLATFGLLLFFNELMATARRPHAAVHAAAGMARRRRRDHPRRAATRTFRLAILATGLAVAGGLAFLIARTRLGMLIRAGATHRAIVGALGVDIRLLFTLVFALGALLAGLAGLMAAPILAVQVGMGEQILIATFVVVVIGGLGSVRGAFVGALLVGLVDTLARAFLPGLLKQVFAATTADALGAGLASAAIYLLMALVLVFRPRGLLPV